MNRQVKERDIVQGEDEKIIYSIDTSPWGGAPASPTVTVKNLTTNVDVTNTVTSGGASVAGDVIALPLIQSLVAGNTYRVEVKYSSAGNTFETWFQIQAEV